MKLVQESELKTFTDPEGDQLITLRAPKKRHLDKRDNMYIGMTQIDVTNPNDPTMSSINIDQAAVNEYMFKAVARKLIIGGQEIAGEKLSETYLDMEGKSGQWIDKCIAEVWGEIEEAKNA